MATRNQDGKRSLRLLAKLMGGARLDRNSAAKALGTEPPAAYQHLKALAATVPGVRSVKGGGTTTYFFDSGRLVEPPSLPEVIAACLASSLSGLFRDSQYEHRIQTVFDFIVRSARRRPGFANIRRKFYFVVGGGEVALAQNEGLLDDAINALIASKWIRIRYVHFNGDEETVDIQPLTLAIHDHQLYLVGQNSTARHPYRFARIRDLEELETRFSYPTASEYDPTTLFRSSFGVFVSEDFPSQRVVVRLHPRWETYALNHRWHPSQEVKRGDNGITVRLQVRVCPEVEAWVLGFGNDAVVIEPEALRTKIAGRLRAASESYGGE
ncbi:MAG: WYL domain-containing protein [Deltaproteobacteria bacterium]|jgi:predicted DNA-binding transcriptional regulator YafY